jgi:hypothetical protein
LANLSDHLGAIYWAGLALEGKSLANASAGWLAKKAGMQKLALFLRKKFGR